MSLIGTAAVLGVCCARSVRNSRRDATGGTLPTVLGGRYSRAALILAAFILITPISRLTFRHIAEETEKWAKVVRSAGLRME